ncbi:MAG: hypothetical protein B6U73_03280 [Desulfurococcales archaeon ex4484_204]|nr:MAG: hypothetical protein B6U73_03280 [Desulfurococcales archaeon ex4484_204]
MVGSELLGGVLPSTPKRLHRDSSDPSRSYTCEYRVGGCSRIRQGLRQQARLPNSCRYRGPLQGLPPSGNGAYQSEYVRGAIRSIDVGQSLAARALGMSKAQELLYVILPQAFRRALPGISNEIIYMIKYSSLAYIVGVTEMFSVSKRFNSLYFRPVEIFFTAAIIYLAMTTAATIGFKLLENKLRIPGLEVEV